MSARFSHGLRFGANPLGDGRTQFRLWAPAQESVSVAVEGGPVLPMTRSPGGMFHTIAPCDAGTRYRYRGASGELDGDLLPVDLAANARSLGARVCRATSLDALREALASPPTADGPTVIVVPIDRESRVGGYESWWDVPVAEVSTIREVRDARTAYDAARRKVRDFL